MPRFFFHVRHGEDFEPDVTRLDLPDADVAQSAGLRALHDLHNEMELCRIVRDEAVRRRGLTCAR